MAGRTAKRVTALMAVAVLGGTSRLSAQVAAFPGALGFGANATGARASATPTVYHVTNLNDSGTGSFRDAVSQSNRIVVFDVGGNIRINSAISGASNLTILGQTAPGQGVAIYGAETSFYGKSNDIVRYVRFMDTSLDPQGQSTNNSSGNCLGLGNTTNMIFDHVSCEFASYNNIDASGTTGANNFTFQNSLIADPINDQQFNFHYEGTQGTFINNVFANAHNRSILGKGNVQFINNTVSNYQAGFTTGNSAGTFNFDIINNNFIAGPSTSSAGDDFYQVDTNQTAYAAGNMLDSNKDGTLSGNADNATGAVVSNTPLLSSTPSLPTLSASASYNWNIVHAGDSLVHDATTYATSLGYDETDKNVMSTVTSLGTSGRLYGTESDDGITDGPSPGIGNVSGGTIVNANYSTLLNPEGYTMVEAWANSLSDATLTPRIWTANSGEWNTAGNWGTTVPNAIAVPGVYDVAYIQGNGSGADASVTVSTSTPNCYQLYIGGNGGAAGEQLRIAGGQLRVYDTVTVGYLNNATMQIDSGTAQVSNVQLGNTVGNTTYTGNLILNGGVLQMQQIVLGGGSPGAWTTGGSVTFNGGTVQATGTFNINAPALLAAAGGTLNTNGNVGTLSGIFGGNGTLLINGGGTLNVTANHTFTGVTRVVGSTLSVGTLANGGTPSPLGAGTNAQSNIVLDGGTLQYTGAGGSTDHLFDLTANGGTLDGSGAGAVSYTNTAALVPTSTGNTVLTLTGTSTGHNYLYAALGDPAGGYTTSVLKLGTGKWSYNGALKTYTGPTHIEAGTFETVGTNTMSHFSDVTLDAGATIDFHATSQTIDALSGAGSIVNNFATSSGYVFTIGANNGGGTFTGTLGSGSLNIVKSGTGIEALSGSNGYVGTTTINGGVLQFGQVASIGGTGTSVTVNTNGTAAAGYAIDQTFLGRINPASTGVIALAAASGNSLDLAAAGLSGVSLGATTAATFSGTINPGSNGYVFGGGNGTLTISNASAINGTGPVIVGVGSANVASLGTLALNVAGSQSYTGITTIRTGGTVLGPLANGSLASALGASSNAATNVVLDGGTLRGAGSTDRLFTLTANGGTLDNSAASSFTNTGAIALPSGSNVTLNLTGSSTAHNTLSAAMSDPTGGGTLSVAENGSGKWTYNTSGSKTYSGTTHIIQGTLETLATNALSANSNLVLDSAGVLDFHDYSAQVIGALSGSGSVINSFAVSHTDTFTIGANNGSGTFSGSLSSGGTFKLIKAGTGSETIAGTASFTGTTFASAGTLNIAGTINNTTVEVDGSASGTTLQLSSVAAVNSSTGVVVTTTAGNAKIDLDLTPLTLGPVPAVTVFSLTVNGVPQPAGMYNSTNDPAVFTSDSGFEGNLTVSAPEPGVVAAMLIGAMGMLRRRRRSHPSMIGAKSSAER